MNTQIDVGIQTELERVTAVSDANPQAGAVIVRGSEILSVGSAKKTLSGMSIADEPVLLIHAKEAALMDALARQVDIAGADMYVLLRRGNGEIRYTDGSYSCIVCSRLLKQTTIKNVVYPTPQGWESITVQAMFEKAIERIGNK